MGNLAGQNIIWQPQPRQVVFMSRPEYEVLYGGAAGGGKSQALVAEALRQVHIPHYNGILFRKTYKELAQLIEYSQKIYKKAYPRAKLVGGGGRDGIWTFPSGAHIYFSGLQHESDVHKYDGLSYDYIAFDELTHFTYDEYSFFFLRNRAQGDGTRVYIRASTNPGNIGHGWVKDRFISPAPPMTTIWSETEIKEPDGTIRISRKSRIFVPSTVFDNKILLANNPGYLDSLAQLPYAMREAYMYGNWDVFSGQVFQEWRKDPAHYEDRRFTHVIEPFPIPEHWRIYRGFDFGYAKPYSVGWYAVDTRGKVYRIRELYGTTGAPNTGSKEHPGEIAKSIARIEDEDPVLKPHRGKIVGIADPSIFDESRGESVAELMAKAAHVYWDRGDNKRIPGKMQVHYRLAFDENGDSMFQVFNTCKHFIRTIPALVYDQRDVEDVDTNQEDHIYDEWRYVMMANPIAARKNVLQKERPDKDPFDLLIDPRRGDRYELYRR